MASLDSVDWIHVAMQVAEDMDPEDAVSHPTLVAAEQLRLEAVENPSTFGGAQGQEYIRALDAELTRVIGVVDGVCEKFSQVRLPPVAAPPGSCKSKGSHATTVPCCACVPRSRALANQNGLLELNTDPVLETASGARPNCHVARVFGCL